jgi:hypothetical protein
LPDTRQSALVLVTLDPRGIQSVRIVPFEIDVVHSLILQPDTPTAKMIQEKLQIPP